MFEMSIFVLVLGVDLKKQQQLIAPFDVILFFLRLFLHLFCTEHRLSPDHQGHQNRMSA